MIVPDNNPVVGRAAVCRHGGRADPAGETSRRKKTEPDSSFPRWVPTPVGQPSGPSDGLERPSYGSLDDQTVLRGGWWTTDVHGSPAMIGEYQDLDSSPFWELDHLSTDGVRSNDVSFIGTDNETTQAGSD